MARTAVPRRRSGGSALVISLILLVVIGLTASVALRGAISHEAVVNGQRMEVLARQYAEIALRYCEAQLQLPVSTAAGLQAVHGVTPVALDSAVGLNASIWFGTSKRSVAAPADQVAPGGSAIMPASLPECFAERITLAGGGIAYLVTARGFSPDWRQDANGHTTAGSSVWLQSLLAMQ